MNTIATSPRRSHATPELPIDPGLMAQTAAVSADAIFSRNPNGRGARRRGSERMAWTFLVISVAAIALSMSLPVSDPIGLAALSLVQFSGGVAALAGVLLMHPPKRSGWILLGVGGMLLGTGAGSWFVYVALLSKPIPYPGWSDAFFIPGYLMLAAGLAVMIRQRSPARELSALLDSLLLAVGLAYANWIFLTGPAVDGLSTGQHIITIVYPALDVMIVALVARLLLTADHFVRSLWLLAAGAMALLGGDLAYAVLAGSGTYATGTLPDQLWMLASVLFGAAALHPSMRRVGVVVESRRAGTTRARLGFMGIAMLVPSVVVVASLLSGTGGDSVALSITTMVFLPLVAVRTMHLVQGLRRIAVVDDLTGLANRDALLERVDRRRKGRATDGAVMLFIDLDHFKNVNDTLGHAAGNQVLITVGERLRGLVRDVDLVARLGGDEFVIVTAGMSSDAEADYLAERVVETLAQPFTVAGQTLYLGASVGTASLDEGDADTILRHADVAMYAAKAAGRSRCVRFSTTQMETLTDEAQLDAEFRQALTRNEFLLHYQPIVDLDSGRMWGAEALVRWQHPIRGLLLPAQFVPLAEKNDTISMLGTWVLNEACEQAAFWRAANRDCRSLKIAVNISARELNAALVDTVRAALAAKDLDPSALILEITETALLVNPDEAAAVVTGIRALGVSVALDDFGTGYSSLTCLRSFAADSLKIDRSFISGLGVDAGDTAVVKAVVDLANALGLRVVAEGVETAMQHAVLRALGCRTAQGYYLGRPAPAEQLTDVLNARPRTAVAPV